MSGTIVSTRRPTWSTWSCTVCARRSIRNIGAWRPSATSAIFSVPMLDRLRQSLAARLAALYALVFALGTAALFGVLYWRLASALDARERTAVENRAADFAAAYAQGGPAALRAHLNSDTSPEVRSLFVRLLGPDGDTVFATVPSDWVETSAEHLLVPDGWGGWQAREIHSVRVPRDAERDFAVTSLPLPD